MAVAHIERPSALPLALQGAGERSSTVDAPPKVMVSLPLDTDVISYFQSETEPRNWQHHINGVLRYYMDTSQSREADHNLMMESLERSEPPSASRPVP